MMKQPVMLAVLLLVALSAIAGVFKCATPNGVVYSERPCASDAKEVNNLAKKPSEENIRSARMRLANDMLEVSNKERQDQATRRDNRVVVIGAPEQAGRR